MADLAPEPVQVLKLKATIRSIKKDHKWRSMNEFLYAFFTNTNEAIVQHSARTLAYQEGRPFLPAQMLDAWRDRCKAKGKLNEVIIEKATVILVEESTHAIRRADLQLDTKSLSLDADKDFGLQPLASLYTAALPCLWALVYALLTAPNAYERRSGTEKVRKVEVAIRISVVIISMLLFSRNRATNAFQLVIGLFLSGCGASQRVIDAFNHMGICVSYRTSQRALVALTSQAQENARVFVRVSDQLYAIVYDNINFTLRKASQRLDSTTEQINATTIAVFSLPKKFTRQAYGEALSRAARNQLEGRRRLFMEEDLRLTREQQKQLRDTMKHNVRMILLKYGPGMRKRGRRGLMKEAKKLKPKIRVLDHEKTQFFPLPALDQEEASVHGTIQVVQKIWRDLLGLAEELIDTELRLMVGDWLTIRNLRLMKKEREDEFNSFERMDWVQEAAMPFHFQLNSMYMLYRTHIGHPDDRNPASLEKHRTLLRRSKLDPKKPEYNKARELVFHSLIARILDCARILLKYDNHSHMKTWKPTWEQFEDLVEELVNQYTTSEAAVNALALGDEVLANSILFMRDVLTFWEFSEAVRDADVGRMWLVYDQWVFMMRGAGCHNYGNEILEMKAQFKYELPPLLREVVERTWLVNRWGKAGRSIPTDLYLEHNNGFEKTMFAAKGSAASMDDVKNKSSACVEVLREIAHSTSKFLGVRDHNRGHTEVKVESDINALCLDLKVAAVHTIDGSRRIPPPKTRTADVGRGKRKKGPMTGVKDVLQIGMVMLGKGKLFNHWKHRTTKKEGEEYAGDAEVYDRDTAFDRPEGEFSVDTSADPDFVEDSIDLSAE